MKKVVFLLMSLLMFSFISCSDDEEKEDSNPLMGTTWENRIEETLFKEVHTIHFSKSSFTYEIISEYDQDGDGKMETEKQITTGTYTIDLPNV